MNNNERIDLVKTAMVDSSVKESIIYLLNAVSSASTPSELRLKNSARGNVSPNVEKGDIWIRFTNPSDLKVLAYIGLGNVTDPTNYQDLGGFQMELQEINTQN